MAYDIVFYLSTGGLGAEQVLDGYLSGLGSVGRNFGSMIVN